ncbi:hypothetical protein STEG23_022925, partial [Scotinomys teguina]
MERDLWDLAKTREWGRVVVSKEYRDGEQEVELSFSPHGGLEVESEKKDLGKDTPFKDVNQLRFGCEKTIFSSNCLPSFKNSFVSSGVLELSLAWREGVNFPEDLRRLNIQYPEHTDCSTCMNGKSPELVFMESLSNACDVPVSNVTICFDAPG